jgi:hypothetical protein
MYPCRDVGHVEVDAEALMARGKKVFDRVERSRLDDVDHHRRRQHRDAYEPTKEAVCSGPTKSCSVPMSPEVMGVRSTKTAKKIGVSLSVHRATLFQSKIWVESATRVASININKTVCS